LRTVVLNPVLLTLLPFIDRDFIDDIQEWFQSERFEMFDPAASMCRFFAIPNMYSQSVLGIIRLAHVSNFACDRIAKDVYPGSLRERVVQLIMRWYSVHDMSPYTDVSTPGDGSNHRSGTTFYLLSIPHTKHSFKQFHRIISCFSLLKNRKQEGRY